MSDFPVIAADDRSRLYTATAGQTDFVVPFHFQRSADIEFAAEIEPDSDAWDTPLVLGVDYQLAGAGEANGGTLTLVAPAALGQRYRVRGLAAIDRLTSLVRNGKFDSLALDAEIARNRMIAQELRRDVDAADQVEASAAAEDALAAAVRAEAARATVLARRREVNAAAALAAGRAGEATVQADIASGFASEAEGAASRAAGFAAVVATLLSRIRLALSLAENARSLVAGLAAQASAAGRRANSHADRALSAAGGAAGAAADAQLAFRRARSAAAAAEVSANIALGGAPSDDQIALKAQVFN